MGRSAVFLLPLPVFRLFVNWYAAYIPVPLPAFPHRWQYLQTRHKNSKHQAPASVFVLFHTILDYDFIHKSVKYFGCQFIIRVYFLATLVTFVSASLTSAFPFPAPAAFARLRIRRTACMRFGYHSLNRLVKAANSLLSRLSVSTLSMMALNSPYGFSFFLSAGRTSLFLAWAVVPRPLI